MTHNYTISAHKRDFSGYTVVSSDSILAEFARQGRTAPNSLVELTVPGCRYSYQDFDVLSNALRILEQSGENPFDLRERLASRPVSSSNRGQDPRICPDRQA